MTVEVSNPPAQDTDQAPSASRSPQWFYLFFYAFIALISGNETTIPSAWIRTLYLATLSAPLIILSAIALRRKFFSAPPPKRWSDARIADRLNSIVVAIMIAGLLCLASSIVLRHSVGRHDPRYTIPRDAFWFLMAWMYVLLNYIGDRRPLPPAPASRAPSLFFADTKPLQSDHWGQTAQH